MEKFEEIKMEDKNNWSLYEVFVRSKQGLSHRHVGSLRAPDDEIALQHARDVYTRRNEGISIWVVRSELIKSSQPDEKAEFFDPSLDGTVAKLGRMDTTQVTLIHKILAAADERNLPLWIGGGWAIDARLGRVTRKHDDIDLTFPGERRGELEAIVEMLGGRVMEELDYGFLAEIGDELLDCEPAWWADEAYEIAEAPQGSCPEAAEGVIAGRPVRCNSWEAIIWDYFYYADEVPPVDWPTKHIESYRLACTSLGAEKVEVLRAAFRSRYAA